MKTRVTGFVMIISNPVINKNIIIIDLIVHMVDICLMTCADCFVELL